MSGAVLNTAGFGNRPETVEIPFISTRSPAPQDINYTIGKRWINTVLEQEFVLTSKSTSMGQTIALWAGLANGTLYISSAGMATMVNGTVTVMDRTCLSTSSVFISPAIWLAGNGAASVTSISNGSFVIGNGSSGETSTYYYMIVN